MNILKVTLTVAMLIANGAVQAGLLRTVVEMPVKAVEATAVVAKDVVTAPGEIVRDVVTAPAKVVGAVPMEREEVQQPKEEVVVVEETTITPEANIKEEVPAPKELANQPPML